MERLTVIRDINASPEAVYAAVSDVTRMGEWSTECHGCTWHEEFDGPAIGALFDGHNRHGEHAWTTQGRIIRAEPGRAFAFECSMYDFHFSTWGYELLPVEGGCRVTEWTESLLDESTVEASKQISGVDDRRARNLETMGATLERLAVELNDESGPSVLGFVRHAVGIAERTFPGSPETQIVENGCMITNVGGHHGDQHRLRTIASPVGMWANVPRGGRLSYDSI